MRKSRIIYAVVLIAVITLTLVAACAKPAPPPTPPAPTGNMPPVIASLTAAQNQTYPGGTVNVQSVVSDPNGDIINFAWTATGGEFVENGRANTAWRAPNGLRQLRD